MAASGRRRAAVDDDMDDGSSLMSFSQAYNADTSQLEPLFANVVKIFATVCPADHRAPWRMRPQQKSTASGFIISERRILTNAHAVADATMVQVRRHGQSDKVAAKIVGVSHCSDIAVLTVEGEAGDAFFGVSSSGAGASSSGAGASSSKRGAGAAPSSATAKAKASGHGQAAGGVPEYLTLAKGVPRLQDRVQVVGFPVGGDELSVTNGVVSRVSYGSYAHSGRDLMYCQVSAAINSGNSGGPVFCAKSGEVLGIAFQSLEQAENVGYIIPIPVVRHVLQELEKTGTCVDFGRLGFYFQTLENPHLKAHVGVVSGVSGVLVHRLVPKEVSLASTVLQVKDVMTHIDGKPIADDGTVAFRNNERLSFPAMLMEKMIGEYVGLRVMRGGKAMEVRLPLESIPPLVHQTLYDVPPPYIVWGGFVLVHLSEPYLQNQYGAHWESKAPIRLLNLMFHSEVKVPGQSVVIIADVLGHPLNAGYEPEEFGGDVIQALHTPDGRVVPAHNLAALAVEFRRVAQALTGAGAGAGSSSSTGAGAMPSSSASASEPVIRLELSDNRMVVLPVAGAEAATREICAMHHISDPMSEDLTGKVQAQQAGAGASSPSAAAFGAGASGGSGSSAKAPSPPGPGSGQGSQPAAANSHPVPTQAEAGSGTARAGKRPGSAAAAASQADGAGHSSKRAKAASGPKAAAKQDHDEDEDGDVQDGEGDVVEGDDDSDGAGEQESGAGEAVPVGSQRRLSRGKGKGAAGSGKSTPRRPKPAASSNSSGGTGSKTAPGPAKEKPSNMALKLLGMG